MTPAAHYWVGYLCEAEAKWADTMPERHRFARMAIKARRAGDRISREWARENAAIRFAERPRAYGCES